MILIDQAVSHTKSVISFVFCVLKMHLVLGVNQHQMRSPDVNKYSAPSAD